MNDYRLRVVGLDLSLTCTGMSDGLMLNRVLQTAAGRPLESRLDDLLGGVMACVHSVRPADLVVIEAPAFSRTGPGHEELAALRIMVRHRLWRSGIPYALVPPTTLKRYVTGHGAATKALMTEAVDDRYGLSLGSVPVSHGRHDLVDALSLAAMGYDHVGQPLPGNGSWPPARDSLESVRWPELISE